MTISRACPQNRPGPSGLRYCQLQAATSVPRVEDIAMFAKTVSSSDSLQGVFRSFHDGATLRALGEKSRLVACDDVCNGVSEEHSVGRTIPVCRSV